MKISNTGQNLRWKHYKYQGIRGTIIKKVLFIIPLNIELKDDLASREVEVRLPTATSDPETYTCTFASPWPTSYHYNKNTRKSDYF